MSTAVVPPTPATLPQTVDRRPASPQAASSSSASYPPPAPLSASSTATSSRSAMATANNDPAVEQTTPSPAAVAAAGSASAAPDSSRSPNNAPRSSGSGVSVKKEPPPSPNLRPAGGTSNSTTTRHRPRKLDLSGTTSAPRGPATTRDGNLAVQDVGLACLSPGFQTQDPAMREQLQRSVAVRDQQRSIIESRLQRSAKGDGPDGSTKPSDSNLLDPAAAAAGGQQQPKTATVASKKKAPPAGLSIVPPSASRFANERIVQSAPLNQTFTGRRQDATGHHAAAHNNQNQNHHHHLGQQPSELLSSSSSHIHHGPATQTNNRLPPIADVFGADTLGARDREVNGNGNGFRSVPTAAAPSTAAPHSNPLGPLPSPGHPPGNAAANSANSGLKRPREYRSAEEAVQELSGGREDLLPRIVHYTGRDNNNNSNNNNNQQQQQQQQQQPGSPPSSGGNQHGGVNGPPNGVPNHHQQHLAPHPPGHGAQQQVQQAPFASTATGRRRARNEYEHDNGSPPLGPGPDAQQFRRGPPSAPHGPFGAGRDSPETQRRKKEEFLGLCSRAWDLFHS